MFENLLKLLKYRALIQSLVARELKARYRGSVLGFFWSFVESSSAAPCLHVRVCVCDGAAPRTFRNYALFFFCGILPWTWFSSSLLESSNVLISGGNLIKKVMFPAEVLPIVTVLSNLVHFFLVCPFSLPF